MKSENEMLLEKLIIMAGKLAVASNDNHIQKEKIYEKEVEKIKLKILLKMECVPYQED